MNSMTSGWAYGGYNSDNGIVYTWEWDFAPAYTVAQVSLHGVERRRANVHGSHQLQVSARIQMSPMSP